jgi:hypothetical protein
VLEGLKRGLTYQAIADEQGVTYDAVKYHVSNMLSKAEVDSREELVAWAAEGRPLGLPSLSILARVAAGVAALAVAGGAFAVLATMGDDETAEDVLNAASEAMADESFSYTNDDCPICSPPEVYEFAPPAAARLSGGVGHDAWPNALIVNGEGYLSNEGRRWLEGSEALSGSHEPAHHLHPLGGHYNPRPHHHAVRAHHEAHSERRGSTRRQPGQ